jgi:hypothetical protein
MTSERWKAKLRLFRLSDAYKACFCDEHGRLTEAGERVLRDLGKFCHQHTSTLKVSPVTRSVDTHAMAAAEGRRDVARRVWAYIELRPEQHPDLKGPEDD